MRMQTISLLGQLVPDIAEKWMAAIYERVEIAYRRFTVAVGVFAGFIFY